MKLVDTYTNKAIVIELQNGNEVTISNDRLVNTGDNYINNIQAERFTVDIPPNWYLILYF